MTVTDPPLVEGEEQGDRTHLGFLALSVALAALTWLLTSGLPFPEGKPAGPGRMALAVTALTAGCWLLRALPMAAASLLPLALFPLLKVQSTRQVAGSYADPILWMFFGGFILALAIERCGLHRRMA